MWSDNETDTDLLGVDRLVDTLVFLAQEPQLRPLTVGVFADWGSGKSSLMRMAETRLSAEPERFLCLTFSPWQHEDYDDVKAALMAAVMNTLQQAVVDERGRLGQMAHETRERVLGGIKRLVRRINWFRLLGAGAKGAGALALLAHNNPAGLALAMPALADVPEIVKGTEQVADEVLKEDQKEAAAEPIEQRIGDFRHDFKTILKELELEALVVFIDDLDRCLPNAILDTLEAIRLFLAVEKTVFVIGADMRIIRHAIATRYPELPGQQLEIGRDYLEKIVQIPLVIPPLNAAEAEGYLNLLGCQRYLDGERFNTLVACAAENRRTPGLDVALNEGIAREQLEGELSEELMAFFALTARVAPILCANLQGNPRQLKRFLNTLILRQRLAQIRNINLDMAVMAKLMVLEYFHETAFRELFGWQRGGGGFAAELGPLEERARRPIEGHAEGWLADPGLVTWLALEPPLAGTNLEPYYSAARDRVQLALDTPRRLTPQLQEILGNLRSESAAVRRQALTTAAELPDEGFRALYDVLLDQFQRDPRAIGEQIGTLILTLAQRRPAFTPALVRALQRTPPQRIQPAFAVSLATTFPRDAIPEEVRGLLREWVKLENAPGLARAAQQALDGLARPRAPRR